MLRRIAAIVGPVVFFCSCSSSEVTPRASADAAVDRSLPGLPDGDPPTVDTGVDVAKDASTDRANVPRDAVTDGSVSGDARELDAGDARSDTFPPPFDAGDAASSGAVCSFNRECPASERCECAEGDCACKLGPRGTGVRGVSSCVSGNDCAEALCVEGPGGAFYCSGECQTDADCKDKLPRCIDVAFVGRICVRTP